MELYDRVALLRGAFKELLTVSALKAIGASSASLYKREDMRPGAMARLAEGAAGLFAELRHQGIDIGSISLGANRLSAWLVDGHPDPSLEDFLRQLSGMRLCPHCQPPRLVPLDEWVGPTGRCKTCHRRKKAMAPGTKSGKLRAALFMTLGALRAKDPGLAASVEKASGIKDSHLRVIDILQQRDPLLGEAVGQVLDSGEAITGPRIEAASEARVKARAFAGRLEAALGLRKGWLGELIVIASLLNALSGGLASAGTGATGRGTNAAGKRKFAGRNKRQTKARSLSRPLDKQPSRRISTPPQPVAPRQRRAKGTLSHSRILQRAILSASTPGGRP